MVCRMLHRRSKNISSASHIKGEAHDIVMVVPETDLECIHEEAQDVASSEIEHPRDLFLQQQQAVHHIGISCFGKSLWKSNSITKS